MTYTPKHRGETKKVWRVEYMESERGWGQDYWHTDFATREEADAAYAECNARNIATTAPDYYIQAISVKEVEL